MLSARTQTFKSILKARAIARFGMSITPTADRESLDECFSKFNGRLCFWFNTEDRSTHLITIDLRGQK